MSFILEALKKSEKERQQGEIPGMQTLQTAASAPAPLRRWWPMLLLSALLLNALCLLWWLHPWQERETTVRAESMRNPGPATLAVPLSVEPALPVVAKREIKPLLPGGQAPTGWNELPRPAQSPVTPRQAAAEYIPLLEELPAAARQALPELTVTMHYYTADPAARLVRINGRNLREGQQLDARLTIERITTDDIVFRSGKTKFRLGRF